MSKAALSAEVKEIKEAHEQALVLRDQAKTRSNEAVAAAVKCGALLLRARENIKQRKIPGGFRLWLEANFEGEFNRNTAYKWMRLAGSVSHGIHSGKIGELPEGPEENVPYMSHSEKSAESVAQVIRSGKKATENIIASLDGKTLRQCYQSLGIIQARAPEKSALWKIPDSAKHIKWINDLILYLSRHDDEWLDREIIDLLQLYRQMKTIIEAHPIKESINSGLAKG
ncbi:MAG: hypothetical protein IID15_08160 [Candidatus Marinimicrobia bacterium]|nr:hypothetical protein [Candidatus Neomarinimicrobiota bacterium]